MLIRFVLLKTSPLDFTVNKVRRRKDLIKINYTKQELTLLLESWSRGMNASKTWNKKMAVNAMSQYDSEPKYKMSREVTRPGRGWLRTEKGWGVKMDQFCNYTLVNFGPRPSGFNCTKSTNWSTVCCRSFQSFACRELTRFGITSSFWKIECRIRNRRGTATAWLSVSDNLVNLHRSPTWTSPSRATGLPLRDDSLELTESQPEKRF